MKETGDPSGKTSSTSWHPQPHHQAPGTRQRSDSPTKPRHPTVPSQPAEEYKSPSSREVPLPEFGLKRRCQEECALPTPAHCPSQAGIPNHPYLPIVPQSQYKRNQGPAPSWLILFGWRLEQSTALPVKPDTSAQQTSHLGRRCRPCHSIFPHP